MPTFEMFSLKTPSEIKEMKDAGIRLARVLDFLCSNVKPGVITEELEKKARKLIRDEGSAPAFLGYYAPGSNKKFPAALCVSVNNIIVHGLPSRYIVEEGDIISLDLGLVYKGWFVDSARTVIAGQPTKLGERLVKITKEALDLAINKARVGNTLGSIGAAISEHVKRAKFSIAEQLTGHGIGRNLHEDPSVLNIGTRGRGIKLIAGMVLAIEPMVTAGSGRVKQFSDDSFATFDGSPSAHFEDTIAITEDGPIVLTRCTDNQ